MIHEPENKKPYNTLWAVLSVDSKGNEGICAIHTPIGPQVAVTGEKKILDIYLDVLTGNKEAQQNGRKLIVGAFLRKKDLDKSID